MMPSSLKQRYFTKLPDGNFQVKPELQELVLFRRLNFLSAAYPFRSKFHFVFCRNVMIYFDTPTKENLVRKLAKVTHEGGLLFIGHSETLGREQKLYSYVKPAVYVKAPYG